MSEVSWDEYWEKLKLKLAPFKRVSWEPITEEAQTSVHKSKFSGIPVVTRSGWPCCKNCNEPMQLFAQINSLDIPNEAKTPFGDGILQVFYCTNEEPHCEVDCESWAPHSEATLLRILPVEVDDTFQVTESPVKRAFPEISVVGWREQEDYPDTMELEDLGVNLSEDEIDFLCEDEVPFAGEKLVGWPCWVQGIEYPKCRVCEKEMNFIFQIDSSGEIPYMFGDSGCAHISQCAEHRNELAMVWACC
ncbi:hypothetical protein swp_0836 [Shewanella piezotolerans WP3]|uniref:DUF1963 domain-containing protein n=1 Tax=Shewanella piezotolerans (strain WP3 / JCM 13877) TaxID=225849 RepID=B8CJ21_SHEPW|nr:DUF1963 domain-containing protein [Shewanella piezotolerans]ACJ27647.1 hypothetical protein swp_0836 [Shewanella piezotolerans WP3]